uniref:cAMP-responsive element modulator n=1 Tax=Capra hircus TaxID=9925 RepID=A0A8C2RQ63_CAPHI
MTMETIDSQQDGSLPDSVAESESAHMQTQTGQNSIPTLAQVSVAGSSTGRGSPAVTLVQLPSGQTVHVQGVIQTPQPSVIQSPQIQTVQVATIAETDESAESEGVIDSHKRREILSRRPSYRKILNELSSDVPGVPKIEEEKSEEEGTPPNIAAMAVPTSIYQTSTGQYTATGEMPTYQIRAPTTALPQGVVMAASPGSLHSPQQLAGRRKNMSSVLKTAWLCLKTKTRPSLRNSRPSKIFIAIKQRKLLKNVDVERKNMSSVWRVESQCWKFKTRSL